MKHRPEFAGIAFAAFLILVTSLASPAGAWQDRQPATKVTTEHKDLKIVSYLTGADIGTYLRRTRVELDLGSFMDGLKLTFHGGELQVDEADRRRILSGGNRAGWQRLGDIAFDVFVDGWAPVLADRLGGFTRGTLRSRSDDEAVSYLMGGNTGRNLARSKVDLDLNKVIEGLSAAFRGEKLKYSEADRRRILGARNLDRQQVVRRKTLMAAHGIRTIDEWEELAEKNSRASRRFLAANGRKQGVETTKSGLQYRIVTRGKGAIPKRADRVRAVYEGRLLDGTVFVDSKVFETRVNNGIPGLSEALQMMPVGSKWKLFIPAGLAYSEAGHRPPVGPNAALVLDVELLGITRQAASAGTTVGGFSPAIAVTFPKQKGGQVEVAPVDARTGEKKVDESIDESG